MQCLEVWGDYALFTRPEMKVERVSYPVITPSACRAIFEAVLWKPAISWQIHRIEVLNPIEWLSVRRNELSEVLSTDKAKRALKSDFDMSINIDELVKKKDSYKLKYRQQRASLLLKDVRYRIYADFELTDKAEKSENRQKFLQMFERRAKKGQCVYQPYLGCREFSGFFRWLELEGTHLANIYQSEGLLSPIEQSQDFGFMLYDLDYTHDEPQPMFFHAKMQDGVIEVPDKFSSEVKR